MEGLPPFYPRRAAQGGRGEVGEDCLRAFRPEFRSRSDRLSSAGEPVGPGVRVPLLLVPFLGEARKGTRAAARNPAANQQTTPEEPHHPKRPIDKPLSAQPSPRTPPLLPLHQPHFPTAKQAATPSANPSAITPCLPRSRSSNSSSRFFNIPASNSAAGIGLWEMTYRVS